MLPPAMFDRQAPAGAAAETAGAGATTANGGSAAAHCASSSSSFAVTPPAAASLSAPFSSVFASRTETAYDWMQRSRRKRRMDRIPTDPSSAAWAFARGGGGRRRNRGNNEDGDDGAARSRQQQQQHAYYGTGISFVDVALQQRRRRSIRQSAAASAATGDRLQHQLPVVDIRPRDALPSSYSRGHEQQCGKTWAVVTLAARFAVATRPSQFPDSGNKSAQAFGDCGNDPPPSPQAASELPQVIILDSSYGVTKNKLVYAVRSALLRQQPWTGDGANNNPNDPDAVAVAFERDMTSCLGRIHLATAGDATEWIPILESVRCKLRSVTDHPTLILWDGLLTEPLLDEAQRNEIIRQVSRLLDECTVMFVATTTSGNYQNRYYEWDKFVTHRIRLDRETAPADALLLRENNGGTGTEYTATVYGSHFPFNVSLAGVLS